MKPTLKDRAQIQPKNCVYKKTSIKILNKSGTVRMSFKIDSEENKNEFETPTFTEEWLQNEKNTFNAGFKKNIHFIYKKKHFF